MDKIKTLKNINVKCQNCGSNMVYSIAYNGLYCYSCQSNQKVLDTKENIKHSFSKSEDVESIRQECEEENIFKCKNCGANISLKKFEYAKKCTYCKSSNVALTSEIEGLKPDKILKFEISTDMVDAKFAEMVKHKFFLPNTFKKKPPSKNIESLYFPAFNFDAKSATKYKGTLYRYVTRDGKSERVDFPVSGTIVLDHKNILVEDSSKITQTTLKLILPYTLEHKIDYKPEYLLGFEVETYENSFVKTAENSEKIMQKAIKNSIIKKHDAEGVVKLNMDTTYSDKAYEYIILPIYIMKYEYRGKKYTTFMNGQTGKLGGKMPMSPWKVGFTVFFVILFLALLILLNTL